jgi:hypothetical protein
LRFGYVIGPEIFFDVKPRETQARSKRFAPNFFFVEIFD